VGGGYAATYRTLREEGRDAVPFEVVVSFAARVAFGESVVFAAGSDSFVPVTFGPDPGSGPGPNSGPGPGPGPDRDPGERDPFTVGRSLPGPGEGVPNGGSAFESFGELETPSGSSWSGGSPEDDERSRLGARASTR